MTFSMIKKIVSRNDILFIITFVDLKSNYNIYTILDTLIFSLIPEP